MREFGFSELSLTENDFLAIGNVIQLGYPPNRIDILTKATGVEFEKCFSEKIQIELDGVIVNFIDIENLQK